MAKAFLVMLAEAFTAMSPRMGPTFLGPDHVAVEQDAQVGAVAGEFGGSGRNVVRVERAFFASERLLAQQPRVAKTLGPAHPEQGTYCRRISRW